MSKTSYLWPLLSLMASCTASLAQQQRQPVTYPGTATPMIPSFLFKGFYDSTEIFQKRGVYYTRIGQQLRKTSRADTLLPRPQKLQGIPYIYVREPIVPPATIGKDLRVSWGRFVDGRKDGEWFYAKFIQVLTADSTMQTQPSPDSTVIEEYRMGRLLRRKRGGAYHGMP